MCANMLAKYGTETAYDRWFPKLASMELIAALLPIPGARIRRFAAAGLQAE